MARPENEIMEEFDRLNNELSPENLCCDGLLSKRKTNQKREAILAEWEGLEVELGRSVTKSEIEDRWMEK